MVNEIERLEAELPELKKKVAENEARQREIHTAAYCEKLGIKMGDTIEFMHGKTLTKGVISDFQYFIFKPINPIVKLFKANGYVGERCQTVWNPYSIKVIQ